jgi:hypothetical protein
VDGKTVRGARNPDGSQARLLAALAGVRGGVAAQAEVGARAYEIPMIIPLLDGLSLDGAVVTADALHTQRATADYVHGHGADFAFPVKSNQPGLAARQAAHIGLVSVLVSFTPVRSRSPTAARNESGQVTDGGGSRRTLANLVGKRVGGNPSGVRISYPPPR